MKMAIIVGALKAFAPLLRVLAEWLDPDTMDDNKKKRALEYAEKYIHTNGDIEHLKTVNPFGNNEKRRLKRLQQKLKIYKEKFFKYD